MSLVKFSFKVFLLCKLLLLLFCGTAYAQSKTGFTSVLDSLQHALTLAKDDTTYLNTLQSICLHYINAGYNEEGLRFSFLAKQKAEKVLSTYAGTPTEFKIKKSIAFSINCLGRVNLNQGSLDEALEYFKTSLEIREQINDEKGLGGSYNNIGIIYHNKGDYDNAQEYHLKALAIRKKIGDKQGVAMSYNNIGTICEKRGDYKAALDNHLQSLRIKEEINDYQGIAFSYNNIGIIHERMGDLDKALWFYEKYMNISKESGDKQGISNAYNNIGNIYMIRKDFSKALECQLQSLKLREETGDKVGVVMAYNNISTVYEEQGLHHKALETQFKSLKLNEEVKDLELMSTTLNNIGVTYTKLGDIGNAILYCNKSLEICIKLGHRRGKKDVYLALVSAYEKVNDYKKAYGYRKLFSAIKDTLLNEQSTKLIAEMNTKYDSEKKDKELLEKDVEINKQFAESSKKKNQRNIFIAIFLATLISLIFIYRGFKQKQLVNKQLAEKNQLIAKQTMLVEGQNQKITDSINYAQRIQQAVLPSSEMTKAILPSSFIFFRPRDIVSGDFYWLSEKNDVCILAVADCTGHGVPGAFMSMIGNTLLNEIVNVKNIDNPAEILSELNKDVIQLLGQKNDDITSQDDGMDITILSFNKHNTEIEYAAANHFGYYITNGKLEMLKGDIYSIGGLIRKNNVEFKSKKIKLNKGDCLYLFTDGFIDQFGGENNSKFLSEQFTQLLKEICFLPIEVQGEKVATAFESWKENTKQLDDVLVFGIKI